MIGADVLLGALAAAEEALARQDASAAAAALAAARDACGDLQAAGARLGAADLARARELHARGAEAACAGRERLARELEQAGHARRALSAYHR